MFGIGTQELIIVLVIFLLLFGAKALPNFAKGLGQTVKEFRNAAKELEKDG